MLQEVSLRFERLRCAHTKEALRDWTVDRPLSTGTLFVCIECHYLSSLRLTILRNLWLYFKSVFVCMAVLSGCNVAVTAMEAAGLHLFYTKVGLLSIYIESIYIERYILYIYIYRYLYIYVYILHIVYFKTFSRIPLETFLKIEC